METFSEALINLLLFRSQNAWIEEKLIALYMHACRQRQGQKKKKKKKNMHALIFAIRTCIYVPRKKAVN